MCNYVDKLIVFDIQGIVILISFFQWITRLHLQSIHVLVCIIRELLSPVLICSVCLTWLDGPMCFLLHCVQRVLAQWFPWRLAVLQSLRGFIALLGWYSPLFLGSFDSTSSCFDTLSRWLPPLSLCLPRATSSSCARWSSSSPYSLLTFRRSHLLLLSLRTHHLLQFIIDFEQIRYTLNIIFINYYLLRVTIYSGWIQRSFWSTLVLLLIIFRQ